MPQSQPRPLHHLAKPVSGSFLGSVEGMDYYIRDDGKHIIRVRQGKGHLIISEYGTDGTILALLARGERDMINRIKAARMMLE